MLKKILSSNNILFLTITGLLVLTQAPTIANNLESEGKALKQFKLRTIGPQRTAGEVSFPPKGRAVGLFWSTTCGPCQIEMARLKSSVEQGKIPKGSLFAINPFESTEQIERFLKKNDFPFTFIQDPGLGAALNVRATPTTIFLDDGKVVSMKSGMSFTGIWSAENFLKK